MQEKEYNRMKQHFGKGNSGNLGIGKIDALNNPLKWRISYVTLQVNDNDEADIMCKYDDHAENIERIWRLEYGWSLLCQK